MRIANCLYDLIGLRGVCTSNAALPLYVNDLPGITNEIFELLTNEDFQTRSDVYNQIQKLAINDTYNAIQGALINKTDGAFRVNNIVSNVNSGEWKQPFNALSAAAYRQGIEIDMRASDNLAAYIDEVYIYAPSAQTITIYVYNLETGETIETFTGTATAAEFVTITASKYYPYRRIFIAYDANTVLSREVTYRSEGHTIGLGGLNFQCDNNVGTRYARIATGTDYIHNNLDYEGVGSGGMIVKYNISCSLENFLCENRERIKDILFYAIGRQMATKILLSDRINKATLISQEKLDGLAAYSENMYQKSIQNFISGSRTADPVCFECRPKVGKRVAMP